MHYTGGGDGLTSPGTASASSHPARSRAGSTGSIVRSQRTLRTIFLDRMHLKHQDKSTYVAISRYYDIYSSSASTMRTHQHRRGSGVAEDCRHVKFSEAQLSLCASPEPLLMDGHSPEVEDLETAGKQERTYSVLDRAFMLASRIVERGKQLVDLVGTEVRDGFDCLDGKWKPDFSLLGGGFSDPVDVSGGTRSLLPFLLDGGELPQKLKELCAATMEVLMAQPVVSEVEAPAKVFGDIHGQLRDLLLLFHFYGRPGQEEATDDVPVSYVFNGDWVDRGHHQLEVVTFLFALKVVYPDLVWLNRGNHEDVHQNTKTTAQGGIGFNRACEEHFGREVGNEIFISFHGVFHWLPLAARIESHILVLHGGLGEGKWTLDQLRSVQRPLTSDDLMSTLDGTVYNILWSDPLSHNDSNSKMPHMSFGVHRSHRSKHASIMKVFGRDITERFCKTEGLALIVRSHQFKSPGKGYEVMHDGWLMRVFSARNYNGRVPNDGGMLLIGRSEESPSTLLVRPQVIERLHRQVSSMILPPEFEPYCPRGHLMNIERPRMDTCMPRFPWGIWHEDERLECARCGQEDLQKECYFHCRGCGTKPETCYDLCLACASVLVPGRGDDELAAAIPVVPSSPAAADDLLDASDSEYSEDSCLAEAAQQAAKSSPQLSGALMASEEAPGAATADATFAPPPRRADDAAASAYRQPSAG
eukprot:CAMPEP_0115614718 /NCGR_PEP_ID=MMETSP0272-20121206/22253_1 /TAXON_ID=71861 /ORGANISM="Scrippsiella trochoidea, Strain CCMP3099" /LENGTH=699 /DNA_ID=CAMNT_0003050611 /DNA_START=195 /DNA_END=2290 /DNA_ORIENTATION=-